jgi:acylpyruvate hydrolase
MKLVTYSWKSRMAPGALLKNQVVDLPRAFAAALSPGGKTDRPAWADQHVSGDLMDLLPGGEAAMAEMRRALQFVQDQPAANQEDYCHPLAEVELRAPVQRPGKVVCVGLNYRSHLAEISEAVPKYPILFHKSATSIIGHRQAIVLPRVSGQVDYEGELAVVIGRRGKYIPEEDALSYVAGYTCANDVSAHDLEFRTSQWTSGKMLDTFCPLGPVLQTRDEIPEPGSLCLKTLVNGHIRQEAYTSDMVFSVPFLISYISSLATLEPGDLILTGTPAGIGCNLKPPVFLKPGDEVTVHIDGVGTLTNPVVAEEGC